MQLLIDIDGVLKRGNQFFESSKPFLEKVCSSNKVKACLLSNSTIFDGTTALSFFKGKIDSLEHLQAITAIDVAKSFVNDLKSYRFIGSPDAYKYFPESQKEKPEAIIIGDLGLSWDAEIMNEIFQASMNGSKLVAMQLNKYGVKNDTIQLDAGAFIHAIQYASDSDIKLLGKPSANFYKLALSKIQEGTEPVFMIGDDLKGDIEGSQKIGATAVLMMTGKTNPEILEKSKVQPNLIMEDLNELSDYFDEKELW